MSPESTWYRWNAANTIRLSISDKFTCLLKDKLLKKMFVPNPYSFLSVCRSTAPSSGRLQYNMIVPVLHWWWFCSWLPNVDMFIYSHYTVIAYQGGWLLLPKRNNKTKTLHTALNHFDAAAYISWPRDEVMDGLYHFTCHYDGGGAFSRIDEITAVFSNYKAKQET